VGRTSRERKRVARTRKKLDCIPKKACGNDPGEKYSQSPEERGDEVVRGKVKDINRTGMQRRSSEIREKVKSAKRGVALHKEKKKG